MKLVDIKRDVRNAYNIIKKLNNVHKHIIYNPNDGLDAHLVKQYKRLKELEHLFHLVC